MLSVAKLLVWLVVGLEQHGVCLYHLFVHSRTPVGGPVYSSKVAQPGYQLGAFSQIDVHVRPEVILHQVDIRIEVIFLIDLQVTPILVILAATCGEPLFHHHLRLNWPLVANDIIKHRVMPIGSGKISGTNPVRS